MIMTLLLLSGLMAGIYFTFSVVIMRSFSTLDALMGARAMITINQVIVKTLFLPLFFGSTVLACVLIASVLLDGIGSTDYLTLLSSAIYIVGMFLVTLVGNVPMNNKLQSLADQQAALTQYWQSYLTTWTRLNHIRTLACLVTALLLCLALN